MQTLVFQFVIDVFSRIYVRDAELFKDHAGTGLL